jgi:hypothetical protein
MAPPASGRQDDGGARLPGAARPCPGGQREGGDPAPALGVRVRGVRRAGASGGGQRTPRTPAHRPFGHLHRCAWRRWVRCSSFSSSVSSARSARISPLGVRRRPARHDLRISALSWQQNRHIATAATNQVGGSPAAALPVLCMPIARAAAYEYRGNCGSGVRRRRQLRRWHRLYHDAKGRQAVHGPFRPAARRLIGAEAELLLRE